LLHYCSTVLEHVDLRQRGGMGKWRVALPFGKGGPGRFAFRQFNVNPKSSSIPLFQRGKTIKFVAALTARYFPLKFFFSPFQQSV
jgi:hypothetical protein